MMKITGLSHLFKWENLHNWWLTKYFFCPTVYYKHFFHFNHRVRQKYTSPWSTKPVISSTAIFVAIDNNTFYKSKLYIFIICQKSLGYYSFFQSLTSVCPTSCHIFKTLNTISTASSFVAIPFTHFMSFSPNMQSVNTFPQCFHFLNRQAIPPNKIMDCFCSIYEC